VSISGIWLASPRHVNSHYSTILRVRRLPERKPLNEQAVGQRVNVNPVSEHALFLKLFVTTAGGW
jgi:hypothetical protein